MWKSAFVGVHQLLNWKMHGETLKFIREHVHGSHEHCWCVYTYCSCSGFRCSNSNAPWSASSLYRATQNSEDRDARALARVTVHIYGDPRRSTNPSTSADSLWASQTRFRCRASSLSQRFSNFFQVGTTFISQNVLRTTLLLGLSNSLGLP